MRPVACFALLVAGLLALPATPVAGQSTGPSLRVVVTDATGAVIVGARVTVRQPGRPERQVKTGEVGVAVLPDLVPGNAEIVVESEGFEAKTIGDRRIRAGVNRVDVRLQIAGLAVTVEVSRDAREKQLDPRGDAFTRGLTADMIAQLPDDPDEMENVLRQMAGPGATFRINGFGGSKLPAKGQIRQIRFSLNTFSAEMHELGMPVVDIVTQPGLDRWHTTLNAGFRNEALTARYAFAPTSASESVRRGGLVLDGPLWRNHTSLSFSVDSVALADGQTYLVSTPAGRVNGVAIRPTDRTNFSVLVEHALTRSHTSRVELTRNGTTLENLGVGGASLPERAYSSTQTSHTLRLSDSGPLTRKLFNESRVQMVWNDSKTVPATDRIAIVVLDAFTAGGAQVNSARRAWDLEAADNVDFAHGRHAMRAGGLLQAGHYRSTDAGNSLGTFTFSSLEAYVAGRPLTYTKRVGNPLVQYGFCRAGWYLQDDTKAHKMLTLSGGLRHEIQSRIDDRFNLSPLAGFTWAPLPNGKLVLRGGAGIVYTWFDAALYEQTLRVDGERQYDVVITNPGYPDPFAGAQPIVLPPSRLVRPADLQLPRIVNTSVALQRQFTLTSTLMVTYTHQQGTGLFRGRNVNAPAPAAHATTASTRVAATIAGGSVGVTSNSCDRNTRLAAAKTARPIAAPSAASAPTSPSTVLWTAVRVAPSASRMPIPRTASSLVTTRTDGTPLLCSCRFSIPKRAMRGGCLPPSAFDAYHTARTTDGFSRRRHFRGTAASARLAPSSAGFSRSASFSSSAASRNLPVAASTSPRW